MTRQRTSSRVTAAKPWKKSSSTLRASAVKPRGRPRNEHILDEPAYARAAPRRRDGAALHISPALVLDAACGSCLLAGGAAFRLGFSANLHHTERGRLPGARRR